METLLKPKRIAGRPKKAPTAGKRAPLSLLIRPPLKKLIDRLATANGTTLSAQAEYLIEQGLAVRQVLDAMGKEVEDIAKGNAEAALRRRGYQSHRVIAAGKAWSVWTEPGFPLLIPTSGFEGWTAEEAEAMRARQEGPAREYSEEELDAMLAAKQKEQSK
jgi:hypothetical protein